MLVLSKLKIAASSPISTFVELFFFLKDFVILLISSFSLIFLRLFEISFSESSIVQN